MKYSVFQRKKPAIAAAASPNRVVLHLYALGGSGSILSLVSVLQMLAMDDIPTRIDLRVNALDFDENSDAQQLLKGTVEALSSMLSELSFNQDTSAVLGALRSASMANSAILNSIGNGDTVGSCVLKLAHGRASQATLAEGLQLLVEPRTHNIVLGNGGYGSPVAGAMIAASHAPAIEAVMENQVSEAQNDNTATHVHLVAASLTGATGFALLPEVLRHLRGQKNVFCLLDGGVFLPHSNAFAQENYLGTRDVGEKARSALNGMYRQNLLTDVNCIVLKPLNQTGSPHKLCPVCKTESTQSRHTSVEYLLGADQMMKMILDPEEKQYGVLDLQWNSEMEEGRPLGWSDLGLDGVKYHRLLRKLAFGASTKALIFDKNDSFIQDIPAIHNLLKKGASLAEIKTQGVEISSVCIGLLQMFWDFAVTGSNLENLNSDIFTIEDRFRLLNIPELDKVLKNTIAPDFKVKGLCSYKEVTALQSGRVNAKVVEKTVELWKGNTTFKAAVDSTRDVQSLNDFYLQLFRSVV